MAVPTELLRITGEDLSAAEDALRRLEPRLKRFLASYLSKYLRSSEDIEDISMTVVAKLWNRRRDIKLDSEASWWGYVAKTARNAALDHLGQAEQQRVQFNLDVKDLEMIQVLCRFGDDLQPILDAADELWLNSDPELTVADRRRRLLAAQLHFLERRPWQEIVRLVSPFRPLSRSELDTWLASPSVKLELAFRHLYRSNDELCRLLLADAAELDEIARQVQTGSAPERIGPWTPHEVCVILYRYRNGLNTEKILQMRPDLSREFVDRVVDQCRAVLPFAQAAAQLRSTFATVEKGHATLRAGGLWRRLVLQYFALDNLPQKHLLERVEPAAEVVDVKMNAGVLNAWLSNGRIFDQLLLHLQAGTQ